MEGEWRNKIILKAGWEKKKGGFANQTDPPPLTAFSAF